MEGSAQKQLIGIIDYGVGNYGSVLNTINFIGHKTLISADPMDLKQADGYILVGVGSFKEAMNQLNLRGIDNFLECHVRAKGLPILGICLGMQLFAEVSFEHGYTEGLGWIKGKVSMNSVAKSQTKLHVGWNCISYSDSNALTRGLPSNPYFYFDHSYHMDCEDEEALISTTTFGGTFTSIVQKGNVFGTQFHPEKSQYNGIKVLENFIGVVRNSVSLDA